MIRSFIAIEIPDELKNDVLEIQKRFKAVSADASWTRTDGIHLTLKFLGNVEEKKIEDIKRILEEIARGTQRIKIKIGGVGAFPNQKMPRVLWIGIRNEDGALEGLYKRIDAELSEMGFEKEDRDFKPHLTLGRMRSQKGREGIIKLLEESKDKELGVFIASDMRLVKSELQPQGAVYTELGRFGFTG
ncbi:MAG: RNA 2',3'-cyclic phosphodiesterase [Nitrospirota bacterium]